MTQQLEPQAVLDTVASVFDAFTKVVDLRFRDASLIRGWLVVLFEGQEGDEGGPYGARIRLPRSVGDETWTAYTETASLREWCTYGVYIRILEEYDTGRSEGRGVREDRTWWLQVED